MAAKPRQFPYLGIALQVVRRLSGLTRREVGALMGVGAQQVGKYENDTVHPSFEALGDLLEGVGLSLTDFSRLMDYIEHMARGGGRGGFQYDLWPGTDSDVQERREVEWVTSVFYYTDRRRLVAIDDPDINRLLDSSLAARKPRQEVLFTLKIPIHPLPRERRPKRGRRGGKGRNE